MRHEEREERIEWWVYLAALTVPLVLVGVLLAVGAGGDPVTRRLYFAVVVLHGGLLAGMSTGWVSLRAAGPWVFVLPTLILVFRLASWEVGLAPPPASLGYPIAVLAWFGPAFALAFLVFGRRGGVVISVVTYAVVYAGAAVSSVGGFLAARGAWEPVAYVAAGHAGLIVVLWVFARKAEQLAATRTRAAMLERQATSDPLTGLANRRRLDDELARLLAQARRYEHDLSVVMLDLDYFKNVNDTYGHDTGDQVLVEVAERLKTVVRGADVLGRWGGEEFMLLTPHTDHAAAFALAERCRRAIAEAPMGVGTVTASFGVATLQADDDARSFRRRADYAMYTAKNEGRDRVVGISASGEARTGLTGQAN